MNDTQSQNNRMRLSRTVNISMDEELYQILLKQTKDRRCSRSQYFRELMIKELKEEGIILPD